MKKNGPEAHLTPSGSNSSNDRGAWTAEDAMNGRGAYGTGIVVTALLMSSPLARAQKKYAAAFPRDSAIKLQETEFLTFWEVLHDKAKPSPMYEVALGSTDDHSDRGRGQVHETRWNVADRTGTSRRRSVRVQGDGPAGRGPERRPEPRDRRAVERRPDTAVAGDAWRPRSVSAARRGEAARDTAHPGLGSDLAAKPTGHEPSALHADRCRVPVGRSVQDARRGQTARQPGRSLYRVHPGGDESDRGPPRRRMGLGRAARDLDRVQVSSANRTGDGCCAEHGAAACRPVSPRTSGHQRAGGRSSDERLVSGSGTRVTKQSRSRTNCSNWIFTSVRPRSRKT